jgi:hypothetical protein
MFSSLSILTVADDGSKQQFTIEMLEGSELMLLTITLATRIGLASFVVMRISVLKARHSLKLSATFSLS